METAVIALSVVVVVQTLALGTVVPILLWRSLRQAQDIDALDQVVEAIAETVRNKR